MGQSYCVFRQVNSAGETRLVIEPIKIDSEHAQLVQSSPRDRHAAFAGAHWRVPSVVLQHDPRLFLGRPGEGHAGPSSGLLGLPPRGRSEPYRSFTASHFGSDTVVR
jgi:hypothetical protein